MRVGIIGCGGRMQTILRNVAAQTKGLDIAFLADPSPNLYEAFAKEFCAPTTRLTSDISQITDFAGIDLILIGSPNHLHLTHLSAAQKTGCKIFCEKPAVHTIEDSYDFARRDARGDFEAGLMFGFVLRFAPLTQHLMAETQDHPILTLEANELLHPEHGAYIMRNWRRKSELAGSFLLDKACHDIDLINLLSRDRPASVASFAKAQIFHENSPSSEDEKRYQLIASGWSGTEDAFGGDKDIVDTQVALLNYPAGPVATFLINAHSAKLQRRLLLACRDKAIEGDFQTNTAIAQETYSAEEPKRTSFEGSFASHYGADAEMAKALIAFASGAGGVRQTPKETIEAGLTTMLIDRAARTGETVNLQPFWDRLDAFYN